MTFDQHLSLKENVALSQLTTIGLGGTARYLVECKSIREIIDALRFADNQRLPAQVIGGGSNIIFPDRGFDGVILRVDLKGIEMQPRGEECIVEAAAGEVWDSFVVSCIGKGLGGVECLSGIPGLVGAVPIQNVGAYGQEVSETIVAVRAIDRKTLGEVEFSNADCRFAYRQSRFKKEDLDRFIITSVSFRLRQNGEPSLRYPELTRHVKSGKDDERITLWDVRNAVLDLRRTKSMVLDPLDQNTRSVGSFFMNPVLTEKELSAVKERCEKQGLRDRIPTFPASGGVKVPAAWLVERAGFHKGYRRGGVGISANHALALVNVGGNTGELLELAELIRSGVRERFGITLMPEPVIIP